MLIWTTDMELHQMGQLLLLEALVQFRFPTILLIQSPKWWYYRPHQSFFATSFSNVLTICVPFSHWKAMAGIHVLLFNSSKYPAIFMCLKLLSCDTCWILIFFFFFWMANVSCMLLFFGIRNFVQIVAL